MEIYGISDVIALYQLDLPDTVYVDVAAPLHSVPHVVLQGDGGGEQGVEGEVAVGSVLHTRPQLGTDTLCVCSPGFIVVVGARLADHRWYG